MKRLTFLIIVVISALALIPVYALERNVWTYSASAEICFETVPAFDPVEEEELIAPADEQPDELDFIADEQTELTTPVEETGFVDEPDKELTDEN